MCGIFGVWNFKGITGADLHRSSALLRHRGPDDEGITVINDVEAKAFAGIDTTAPGFPHLPPELPCPNALLHRRLSIIDLSPRGHQPMPSPDGSVHMVFNGEIYNFKELAQVHHLNTDTDSDTEVVMAMFQKFGVGCFSHFRGMWAMAILDLARNELILSRDRFGIKPLYFSQVEDALAFSSEIKPLLALPGIDAVCSRAKILQFLTYGGPTDPHETFFDPISALKPGTFRVWNLTSMQGYERTYYTPGRERIEEGAGFNDVFNASMGEHLIADVEVGSCLSGGLDSSAIVAKASGQLPRFKTFTCAFPGEDIDESAYARKLTAVRPDLEQRFTTPTAEGFFAAIDELVELQERPIGSASIFAQYSVMELAASHGMKVLLDGQGADEVLGGYYPFAGAYLLGLLRKGKVKAFKTTFNALRENFNPAMGKAMLRAAYYGLPNVIQQLARKKARVGSGLISPAYRSLAENQEAPDRGSTNFHELQLRSLGHGLYELLHYEDRNAMHFGIESRVPFLDHRLVDWALSQKPETLIRKGWTKAPIRDLLAGEGLEELAWRKDKLGFVAPQKRWKESLQPMLMDRFAEMEIPDIFDRKGLEAFMTSTLHSNEDQTAFWRLFSLLRWLEIFKVKLV